LGFTVILQNFKKRWREKGQEKGARGREKGCREKLEEPRGARDSRSLIEGFARIIAY